MCIGQEVCPSPQTCQEEKQEQVKPGEGEREKSKDIDRLHVLIKPGIVSMLRERKRLVQATCKNILLCDKTHYKCGQKMKYFLTQEWKDMHQMNSEVI